MRLLNLGLGLVFIFCATSFGFACSCAVTTAEKEFGKVKALFVGKVLSGSEDPYSGNTMTDESLATDVAGAVKFSVIENFKGVDGTETTIKVDSMRGTSCGTYFLEKGETYLVYAYKHGAGGDEKLSTGVCTRTSELSSEQAETDLKFLRNLPTRGSGGKLELMIGLDTKEVMGGGFKLLPNINLSVERLGNVRDRRLVKTDGRGKVAVAGLKPGIYRVQARLPSNLILSSDVEETDGSIEVEIFDRATSEALIEVEFNNQLKVRLSDVDGNPFNLVTLYMISGRSESTERILFAVRREDEETFLFDGIPPGKYVVYIEFRKEPSTKGVRYFLPGTFDSEQAKEIVFSEKVTSKNLSFVLPSQFRFMKIDGRIFLPSGEPITNGRVILKCSGQAPDGTIVLDPDFEPVKTDSLGNFTLSFLSGQKYWLVAGTEVGGEYRYSDPFLFDYSVDRESLTIPISPTNEIEPFPCTD